MKHIVKGPESAELAAWKAEWGSEGRAPKWEDLPGDVSQATKRALFAEQGHLCCYCGRRIVDGDSHVEHFVPRSPKTGDPSLTFSWDNLLASCQANLTRGDPIHCGIKKGDWYDASLLVSPLDASCEARFRFELDGRVRAAHEADPAAAETIRRLDLDGPRLRGLRKGVIDGLFAMLEHELALDEYERLAKELAQRDRDGRFASFCFVLVPVLDFFCARPIAAPHPPEAD